MLCGVHQWVQRLQLSQTPLQVLQCLASSAAGLASGSRLYASPEYRDKVQQCPASASGANLGQKIQFSFCSLLPGLQDTFYERIKNWYNLTLFSQFTLNIRIIEERSAVVM